MNAQPNCFVSGILASILRLSRLGGIAPIRFVKLKNGWRIYPCPSWNIYGYILVGIFIMMNIGSLIGELLLGEDDTVHMRTKTRRMVWIVQIGLTMATAGTAVYEAPKQMYSMIVCMNQVQKINADLNIHHWPKSLKRYTLFMCWVIVSLVLALVDYVVMNFSTSQLDAEIWVSAMNFFYYCCYWIMLLREMQFIIITMHVRYIFRAVNDSLKGLLHELAGDKTPMPLNEGPFNVEDYTRWNNYINSLNNSEIIVKSTSSHHKTVRRLALAYTSICAIVRNVDQRHGLIVLMTLISYLLHLVCTPYYFITNMFDKTAKSGITHVLNVTLQLLWCFFHTFNMVMLIEPCHLTHMEMEKTRELVSHLMRWTTSIYEPLAVELELFFMHLILNEVYYKPLQVTTMTRGLVVTILGSITTYLVVIIQL